MHVIQYIISMPESTSSNPKPDASNGNVEELEAQAVDQAKISADAAFRPPTSVWNATSPEALLQSVDGPNLHSYEAKASTYVGRSVPVAAGGNLVVPIQVSTPGSVVEYAVELQAHDVSFEITAEREEGVTVVKEEARFAAEESPVTQKFLVGTVPCLLSFHFDNSFSWMREKVLSYKITVTPPSKESLAAGRRRRAQACLKAVREDHATATERLKAASSQKTKLDAKVQALAKQLAETQKAAQVATKEETWLQTRQTLRAEQEKLLESRLKNGWKDEVSDSGNK
jgi:hypothetical protein